VSIGTCKLCNQVKKLVKAHIIPRSFELRAKGVSKSLLEARQYDVKTVKIWQNGVWDDKILCAACEDRFKLWDDYGFKILGNPPGNNVLPRNEAELESFILKDIDYALLKLFILSVLWRASVSSQPFFSKIRLGKHEAAIADMIRNQNPGSYDQFAVIIGRLVGQQFPNALLSPRRQRTPEGINFSVMFINSIKIMVKVDRQALPQILEPVVLKPQQKNIAMPMPLFDGEIVSLREGAEIFRGWLSKTPSASSTK